MVSGDDAERVAAAGDGWRVDGWSAQGSAPYNATPGWDADHWFELPLDNEHLFRSVHLQSFPSRVIPGRLFTTRMPRDLTTRPHAAVRFAEKARLAQLRLVVVLTEQQEYRLYSGTGKLLSFYEDLGAQVLARPIPDFGVPSRLALAEIINEVTLTLADGGNVLVHCAGGSGRTGIVVCGVLRNLGVHDAIAWARRQKSSYVETAEQRDVVESMPLTITAELVARHPILVEVMAAEMTAAAVRRARLGSFDRNAEIDPAMLDTYQTLWDLLDDDSDGRVNVTAAASEVETILTDMRASVTGGGGGMSVRRLLAAVDLDGDEEVSFSEFCLVMSQPLLPPLSDIAVEEHVSMSAASSGGETALAAASAFRKAWEGADNRTREAMEEAVGLEPGAVGQLRANL